MTPRRLLQLLTLTAAFGSLSTSAQAAGGTSIATAPAVMPEQTQFGNTALGVPRFQLTEFWALDVTRGDAVKIMWGVRDPGLNPTLTLLPAGTTDATLDRFSGPTQQVDERIGRAALAFTARASGTMPLMFSADSREAGPYDLTVLRTHQARVVLKVAKRIGHRAAVGVRLSDGDGNELVNPKVTVRLQAQRYWTWRTLGTFSAAKGSFATTAVLNGTGRRRLRAIISGEHYVTAASAPITIVVG